LLELDAKYQLNSRGEFDDRPDYLRIDNTTLAAATVAEQVISHFGLPRIGEGAPKGERLC